MAIEPTQDITNAKRLEEQRSRQSRPSDCDKSEKNSRKYMTVMVVIGVLTSSLFITSSYFGSSAIISVRYNFSGINVTPTKTIPIDYDGTYASSINATFTPLFIFIGFLYPKTDPIFHTESYLGQYPNNMISGELIGIVNGLDDVEDYFFASSYHFINTTQDITIKLRMSADFTVLFKVVVLVDFLNESINDQTISFVYITNRGTDNLGRPYGICTFGLTHTYTLALNVTNLLYDYDNIQKFFRTWSNEFQIQPYPFYMNATLTNSYNWENYWGVK